MHQGKFSLPVVALGALMTACACSHESEAHDPAPDSSYFVRVTSDGEVDNFDPSFEGTWIDIVPGVDYQQTLVMQTGMETERKTVLNGHPLSIDGDFIVIGPKRYGPIASGTRVTINPEGVRAGETLLGPLPERGQSAD